MTIMSVFEKMKKLKISKSENQDVLKELKMWRKNIASKKNIPAYFIFHDSTLISIANLVPKTEEELDKIKGVGRRKIQSYGEDILKIVNKYNQPDLVLNKEIITKTHDKELPERVKTPDSLKTEIFTVGELTKYIKNLLESDRKLTNLWVRGEISNLKQHASGHIYFSLKDKESQIRCVLFRRVNEHLNFNLEHGMKIIIRGNIEVYELYGEYSIIIEEIQPDGLGALNLAFIQLKNKLEKEGLFSNEHKKLLPKFPEVIGIITSSTGAAIQDILNIIKRRYPLVRILIAPTIVQGKEAATSIVESIKLMNELSYVDVIILGRGGGSLEDLWCFNEEIVARSIFESEIPIISAVGHETDFTIADFVADYRASTPSAAAEKVVPDIQEIYNVIYNFYIRNTQAIRYIVESHKSSLKQILNRPIFKRPFDRIHSYYREMDHMAYKLQATTLKITTSKKKELEIIESKIFALPNRIHSHYREMGHIAYKLHAIILKSTTSKRKELEIIESKIFALSPKSILKRGYSIIMKDHKIVKSYLDVKLQDNINVVLHNGGLDTQVKKIRRN
jgi:exodeoxyribonuclease VII large subunit